MNATTIIRRLSPRMVRGVRSQIADSVKRGNTASKTVRGVMYAEGSLVRVQDSETPVLTPRALSALREARRYPSFVALAAMDVREAEDGTQTYVFCFHGVSMGELSQAISVLFGAHGVAARAEIEQRPCLVRRAGFANRRVEVRFAGLNTAFASIDDVRLLITSRIRKTLARKVVWVNYADFLNV